MAEKLTLARLKKFGKNFELSVDPDKALLYKKGQMEDLREALLAEKVFSDARKGLVVSEQELQQAFGTSDALQVADLIIKNGEIQLTAEHRSQEREQKFRRLVDLIHKQAVDPKTGLPHPATRIEAALEQGKVQIDYNKPVEEQLDAVVRQLQPILPLKIEQKKLTLTIPAQYAGKLYAVVKNSSRLLNEEWTSRGDWKVQVEIPAGIQLEFIDKLNGLTHGQVVVEM